MHKFRHKTNKTKQNKKIGKARHKSNNISVLFGNYPAGGQILTLCSALTQGKKT